jgi:hypothetical protein
MKFILVALIVAFTSASVFAAGELGVGAMLGNPTGLNAKYWLGESTAVDGGMAFSLARHSQFSMHSDYLFHSEGALVFQDQHPLDVYYGVGGRMQFADEIQLGLRLPIGVAHRFENNTSDVFGEIAPIVDFIGRTGLDVHLAVGARYYF